MKKTNLIKIILLLIFLAINKSSFAESVNEQQAQIIAENFMKEKLGCQSLVSAVSFKQFQKNGDIAFYIVNFSANKGFVIVSGDDVLKPVIAYSTESNFSMEASNISGIKYWLEKMKKQHEMVKNSKMKANPNTTKLWLLYSKGYSGNQDISSSIVVDKLLNTEWKTVIFIITSVHLTPTEVNVPLAA